MRRNGSDKRIFRNAGVAASIVQKTREPKGIDSTKFAKETVISTENTADTHALMTSAIVHTLHQLTKEV